MMCLDCYNKDTKYCPFYRNKYTQYFPEMCWNFRIDPRFDSYLISRIRRRRKGLKQRAKNKYGLETPQLNEFVKLVKEAYKNGFLCCYCGCKMKEVGVRNKVFTFDHKIPLDRGGTNDINNLCVCCKPCNRLKLNMTEQEFVESYSIAIGVKNDV